MYDVCRCTELYRGEYCEFDNPCRDDLNPCLNGADCTILISDDYGVSSKCTCTLGTATTSLYSSMYKLLLLRHDDVTSHTLAAVLGGSKNRHQIAIVRELIRNLNCNNYCALCQIQHHFNKKSLVTSDVC